MQPMALPVMPAKFISATKSCDPNALSLRAWMHMMASETTLMNAVAKLAMQRRPVNTIGSFGAVVAAVIKPVN